MSEIKLLGKMVDDWHVEWDASPELQFQFVHWTDYAFKRKLQGVWQGSADLQRDYGSDFREFSKAVKGAASAAYRARQAAAVGKAKEQHRPKDEKTIGGRVKGFINRRFPPTERSG